jgi:hypothetical protein
MPTNTYLTNVYCSYISSAYGSVLNLSTDRMDVRQLNSYNSSLTNLNAVYGSIYNMKSNTHNVSIINACNINVDRLNNIGINRMNSFLSNVTTNVCNISITVNNLSQNFWTMQNNFTNYDRTAVDKQLTVTSNGNRMNLSSSDASTFDVKFLTSGMNTNHDVKLQAAGGTMIPGSGTLDVYARSFNFQNDCILRLLNSGLVSKNAITIGLNNEIALQTNNQNNQFGFNIKGRDTYWMFNDTPDIRHLFYGKTIVNDFIANNAAIFANDVNVAGNVSCTNIKTNSIQSNNFSLSSSGNNNVDLYVNNKMVNRWTPDATYMNGTLNWIQGAQITGGKEIYTVSCGTNGCFTSNYSYNRFINENSYRLAFNNIEFVAFNDTNGIFSNRVVFNGGVNLSNGSNVISSSNGLQLNRSNIVFPYNDTSSMVDYQRSGIQFGTSSDTGLITLLPGMLNTNMQTLNLSLGDKTDAFSWTRNKTNNTFQQNINGMTVWNTGVKTNVEKFPILYSGSCEVAYASLNLSEQYYISLLNTSLINLQISKDKSRTMTSINGSVSLQDVVVQKSLFSGSAVFNASLIVNDLKITGKLDYGDLTSYIGPVTSYPLQIVNGSIRATQTCNFNESINALKGVSMTNLSTSDITFSSNKGKITFGQINVSCNGVDTLSFDVGDYKNAFKWYNSNNVLRNDTTGITTWVSGSLNYMNGKEMFDLRYGKNASCNVTYTSNGSYDISLNQSKIWSFNSDVTYCKSSLDVSTNLNVQNVNVSDTLFIKRACNVNNNLLMTDSIINFPYTERSLKYRKGAIQFGCNDINGCGCITISPRTLNSTTEELAVSFSQFTNGFVLSQDTATGTITNNINGITQWNKGVLDIDPYDNSRREYFKTVYGPNGSCVTGYKSSTNTDRYEINLNNQNVLKTEIDRSISSSCTTNIKGNLYVDRIYSSSLTVSDLTLSNNRLKLLDSASITNLSGLNATFGGILIGNMKIDNLMTGNSCSVTNMSTLNASIGNIVTRNPITVNSFTVPTLNTQLGYKIRTVLQNDCTLSNKNAITPLSITLSEGTWLVQGSVYITPSMIGMGLSVLNLALSTSSNSNDDVSSGCSKFYSLPIIDMSNPLIEQVFRMFTVLPGNSVTMYLGVYIVTTMNYNLNRTNTKIEAVRIA